MRSIEQLPPAEFKDVPESPYSPSWERVFEQDWRSASFEDRREHRPHIARVGSSTPLPETDLQAMMQAKPHATLRSSLESTAYLREPIADAIDALPERLKWIFEARYYRGLSVREVGRELSLSKSYVDRLHKQAVEMLREQLAELVPSMGQQTERSTRGEQ